MESKNTKTSFGKCRCCLTIGHHRDIMKEYYYNGIREVYFDTFMECFNLFLSTNEQLSTLICSSCVTRLRDASTFRTLAVSTERELLSVLSQGEDKHTVQFVNVPVEAHATDDTDIKMEGEVKDEPTDVAFGNSYDSDFLDIEDCEFKDQDNNDELLKFDDNNSLIDGLMDDHEDGSDFVNIPQTTDDSSDESDNEDPTASMSPSDIYWKHQDTFTPNLVRPYSPLPVSPARVIYSPFVYFSKYIPDVIYDQFSVNTNKTYKTMTGRNFNTTKDEIKTFFGICFAMSCFGLPKIKMHWSNKTRVPIIADRMARDRFFKLRINLKLVNDVEVDEVSKRNKFWKIDPLIETIRQVCLGNPRPQDVSVGVHKIPLFKLISRKQQYKNRDGFINYVCTAPDGLPLDFILYDGQSDEILPDCEAKGLNIGEKVILKFSKSLPEGTNIYMEKYFTSIRLLDRLNEKNIKGTGCLSKSKLPKGLHFKTDKQLKDTGHGCSDQAVRCDGQMACLKWFDRKAVVLVSTVDSKQPVGKFTRWRNKYRRTIEVEKPFVVKRYGQMMNGVEMFDGVVNYHKIPPRCKKWTIRLIFHYFDFAAAAAWLLYKRHCKLLKVSKNEEMDYLDFKMSVSNSLLHTEDMETTEFYGFEGPNLSRKRSVAPLPPPGVYNAPVGHLPAISDTIHHRCRLQGCKSKKTRVKCTTCNIHLCLVTGRNCYKQYHEML